MERALRWYHHHPEKIRDMQRQAVQRIHEQYSWDKVMQQYLHLYGQAQDNIHIGSNPSNTAKEISQ
jgi:glycogen synthase